jgi:hypothetical protein
MNLQQALICVREIVRLDAKMQKMQDNPVNWMRTLGVPGNRYMPEWEKLMTKITAFYGSAKEEDVNTVIDAEMALRRIHNLE